MYIYIYMYIYIHIFENLTKYIKIYSTPLFLSVLCHHFAKKIRSKSPDPEKSFKAWTSKKAILPAITKSLNESFGVFLHSFQRAGSEFKKGVCHRDMAGETRLPKRKHRYLGGRGRGMFFWHLSAAAVYCLLLNDIARGEDSTKLRKILCPALMSGVGKKTDVGTCKLKTFSSFLSIISDSQIKAM